MIVTVWGAGDATVEMVVVCFACAPENSVELRIFGVLFRCGLCSRDNCSHRTCLSLSN